MLLRYPDRPLSALGIGYILVAGTPIADLHMTELHLSSDAIPRMREISRRIVSSIFLSLAAIGFTLIFYGPPFLKIGLGLNLVAGGISMGAGIGQLFGYWDWTEYRENREAKEDKAKLERVLGTLEAPLSAQELIDDIVNGNKDSMSFQTKCGALVTTRTPEGFSVSLGEGEKSKTVGLVCTKVDELDPVGWADKAIDLVRNEGQGGPWEALLDLYR